jgi:hypothetical protein
MTFLRLPPLQGEADPPPRLSLCDQRLIGLGYGGDQGQQDLASSGHLVAAEGERRSRLQLLWTLAK